MSIKPSVVYIKGVHSITDTDQTPDIGFPNIGLDKLFEGAILKEYTGDYDPSKEYVYVRARRFQPHLSSAEIAKS